MFLLHLAPVYHTCVCLWEGEVVVAMGVCGVRLWHGVVVFSLWECHCGARVLHDVGPAWLLRPKVCTSPYVVHHAPAWAVCVWRTSMGCVCGAGAQQAGRVAAVSKARWRPRRGAPCVPKLLHPTISTCTQHCNRQQDVCLHSLWFQSTAHKRLHQFCAAGRSAAPALCPLPAPVPTRHTPHPSWTQHTLHLPGPPPGWG